MLFWCILRHHFTNDNWNAFCTYGKYFDQLYDWWVYNYYKWILELDNIMRVYIEFDQMSTVNVGKCKRHIL